MRFLRNRHATETPRMSEPSHPDINDLPALIRRLCLAARDASSAMARASTARKNLALRAIADSVRRDRQTILDANARDVQRAQAAGLDPAALDRLRLTEKSVEAMAVGVEQIIQLPDPVGNIDQVRPMPSGIEVGRMRVPLGVIGIIYESRPNVTVDAAALCLKSGNATILRGGSEAIESNRALASIIANALATAQLPPQAVQLVPTTDRAAVGYLISDAGNLDVIVPRGGRSLIERLMRESRVPMIKHLDGICHVYIDESADPDQALRICDNAKTQRYGTCNTMETLLVAAAVAGSILPPLAGIYAQKQVQLRCCPESLALLNRSGCQADLQAATDEDWTTEYLAPILAIRLVDGLDAAIDHINRYGSHHTDAIITTDHPRAMRFLREVDSASVMINASTRFADGFEFGLGAEIGISNDKLHARGPVGLEGLTSVKYVVFGHGEVRG